MMKKFVLYACVLTLSFVTSSCFGACCERRPIRKTVKAGVCSVKTIAKIVLPPYPRIKARLVSCKE